VETLVTFCGKQAELMKCWVCRLGVVCNKYKQTCHVLPCYNTFSALILFAGHQITCLACKWACFRNQKRFLEVHLPRVGPWAVS